MEELWNIGHHCGSIQQIRHESYRNSDGSRRVPASSVPRTALPNNRFLIARHGRNTSGPVYITEFSPFTR